MAEANNINGSSTTEKNGPIEPKPNFQDNESSGEESKNKRQPVSVTITDLELEQLKKEAADYKDKYFRVLAESENIRKRLQKERQELIQFAVQNVIADFLNPIDHLENAAGFAQQASDEVKHWALGFQMILSQFKDVLANNGAFPIKSEGTPFDPHYHEAIEMVPTADYPPGTVVCETLKGYRMGERTIRPARVKVSEIPQQVKEDDNKEVEQN